MVLFCIRQLQEDGKTHEDAADNSGQAHACARHKRERSSTSRLGSAGLTTESDCGRLACGRRGCGGLGQDGSESRVAGVWSLSTAGMVGTARRRACVVTTAVLLALVAPLSADEVRESLRVLSDVGLHAILAHAAVGQGVGVARVVLGGHGVYAGDLEADERALSLILLAPVVSLGLGHRIGIDRVRVVELCAALGGGEASKGGSAEDESGGMHSENRNSDWD